MRLALFAVRDSALDAFGNPFTAQSTGVATRSFVDEVKNPESQIHAHPEDYVLFRLGVFDTDTGTYETHVPEQVLRAQDVTL